MMRGFWLIFKHELSTTIGRRSFQLAVFGLPLLALGIFVLLELYSNFKTHPTGTGAEPANLNLQAEPVLKPEGYVDFSGLIHTVPTSIQGPALIAYRDEQSARQALEDGLILHYYIIPAEYLTTGDVYLIQEEPDLLAAATSSSEIQWLLTVNLLKGDENLARRITMPFKLENSVPQTDQVTESQYLVAFFLPFGVTLFFYVAILMSASLLLGSLTVEKENRVLEILLTSISPGQLFSGKILGLGLAGLIQTFIWFGTGLLILRWSGNRLQIPPQAQLSATFFAQGILFFILGYGLYACLMASIGAFVKNLREASQFSLILLLPMLVPVLTISILISAPDSPFIVGLSLFPLTSPVSMLSRLVITQVPAWQLVASVILLILAILLTLKLVARLFRLQTLLTGSPWSFSHLSYLIKGN